MFRCEGSQVGLSPILRYWHGVLYLSDWKLLGMACQCEHFTSDDTKFKLHRGPPSCCKLRKTHPPYIQMSVLVKSYMVLGLEVGGTRFHRLFIFQTFIQSLSLLPHKATSSDTHTHIVFLFNSGVGFFQFVVQCTHKLFVLNPSLQGIHV